MPRKPIGDKALTDAERQQKRRDRLKRDGFVTVRDVEPEPIVIEIYHAGKRLAVTVSPARALVVASELVDAARRRLGGDDER